MAHWKDLLISFVINKGFEIIGALVILIIGWMIASWIARLINRQLLKRGMHEPMRLLITRIVKLCIIALALMLAADKFGVQIAPFIAGVGVLGVGVGLAAQGVLSNVVAGLTIIFSKPFLVGDYVDVGAVDGKVETIGLFSTILRRADLSRVLVPNRKIVGEVVHNYSTIRQLDMTVGIAYGSSVTTALSVARQVVESNLRVLKEPRPSIGISALADSSVNLALKPWVKGEDMGAAQTEILQGILAAFASHGIDIPFPQREIRMIQSAPRTPVALPQAPGDPQVY